MSEEANAKSRLYVNQLHTWPERVQEGDGVVSGNW